MRIEAVEVRIVALPLVTPFAASHGTTSIRTAVLVRLAGPDGEGWGECAALPEPTYSDEFVDDAFLTIRGLLAPRLLTDPISGAGGVSSVDLPDLFADVVGHPMAKAAIEMALLDFECRSAGVSLAQRLAPHPPGPAASVPAGVAIGLLDTPDALAQQVAARVAEGYGRVKIKIAPGRDVEFVRAARQVAGRDIVLVVDANGAYRIDGSTGEIDDARALSQLDEFDLACIEQPLAADNLLDHAELARRLDTPICLDESLASASITRQALDMGACSVICVKAPRFGSWLVAADVLDHCANNEIPAWVGGMLDTGLGRAANIALAAHPGATIAGDISATARFFSEDVCPPFVVDGPAGAGSIVVPTGDGLGVTVDPAAIGRLTTTVDLVRA
jgi:O-succinylbenzoate synthase